MIKIHPETVKNDDDFAARTKQYYYHHIMSFSCRSQRLLFLTRWTRELKSLLNFGKLGCGSGSGLAHLPIVGNDSVPISL